MKKNLKPEIQKGEIVIYRTTKNEVELKVKLKKETVWLSLDQMAFLFNRDKSVISRHIKNIFQEKELNKNSVVAKFATTAADGKIYQVDYYNLDAIISVGYRIKSQNGVRFRIWASKILKQYLTQGYAANEKRLLEARDKFQKLQEAISFLKEKSEYELLAGQEREILSLLENYSKTFTLLEQYDTEKLRLSRAGRGKFILLYEESVRIVAELKKELSAKKEAGDLFGQEYEEKFKGILGNIRQTFGGKELYSSLEEKAAHLLYFIIKDHPFADGNKRIGSLAILIAVSNPGEKETMIRIITNILS
ncbi:MAG: virulence protein RhuM/Fic/DOC family protein [Candidatus Nealsonbacteria bacterium]|nr:virulence protein RhuM/Fic/DOC family protein [Candidatus Nealsonbacteria bacterium]